VISGLGLRGGRVGFFNAEERRGKAQRFAEGLAVREVSDINVGVGFMVIVFFYPDVSKLALLQGVIEQMY
jgi:hypothetical protein